MSYLVKKVPMENESNISFGGTIILLIFFAQKYRGENIYWDDKYFLIVKPIYIEIISYNQI